MCCALEAAGVENLCASEDCHLSNGTNAPLHGCNIVESGGFQSVVPTFKTAPSATFVCACLICLKPAAEAPADVEFAVIRDYERPRDWTVRWHFERRAAALAHAPDSLIA
jgi:hypothetical protein